MTWGNYQTLDEAEVEIANLRSEVMRLNYLAFYLKAHPELANIMLFPSEDR